MEKRRQRRKRTICLWISMVLVVCLCGFCLTGCGQLGAKQAQSVSTTPVVFGIKQSLAEKLGFVGKEVSVKDLLSAIQEKKMTFCMTTEDLKDETLKKEITGLLSGIDRSSGSSGWLKDMFLKGDYDAMVNYEALIISANQTLEQEALNLYQTQFKKPSLNVYCLDFSGSMEGEGNIVLTFSNEILDVYTVEESTEENLQTLYDEIAAENCMGGTDIYLAAQTALELISESYDLSQYTPAIILMTDGKSNGDMTYQDFEESYRQAGADVPVFSILFGDAEETQLKELAELTNARIFDGTKNLTEAFRSVKGYN